MSLMIILLAVICLAYANGANDNFKGVATLFGSGTTNYRRALSWATVTTFLGSLTALFLAETLLKSFSGKGLVDASLVQSLNYGAAVALGAGLTVLIATKIGMPVSTTHGLVGALIGAGLAAGSIINFHQLTGGFFVPLLISPVVALVLALICYPVLKWTRHRMGVTEETCLCVGNELVEIVPANDQSAMSMRVDALSLEMGNTVTCQQRYQGRFMGFEAAALLDRLHFLSAGILCFARGLNDTPKIAALLLLAPALGKPGGVALVGIVIALGGIISARKVAETMSNKITTMNHGQGFTANVISGFIIIVASKFGMPVSTTHVSCGALFGIGAATGQGRWRTICTILGAWVITLPLGAALGAIAYYCIQAFLK